MARGPGSGRNARRSVRGERGHLALGGTELALRMGGYDPLAGLRGFEWRGLFLRASEHPPLTYELTPGASGSGWETEIRINSLGFRDGEVTRAKSPAVRRAVVIGDSITLGNGLPVAETYPKLLERRIAGLGVPCEALNLGVGDYGALEGAAFLDAMGLVLEPDLAIFGY